MNTRREGDDEEESYVLTIQRDAQTKLKPLQLNGASSDKNSAGKIQIQISMCFSIVREEVLNSLVNGVIAIGDNKLAIDCTPATNPCAFPC